METRKWQERVLHELKVLRKEGRISLVQDALAKEDWKKGHQGGNDSTLRFGG